MRLLARINELKNPVTIIPPNISGMFIHGYHIKLRYVVAFVVVILMWTVAASVSSVKYREEAFAYYSMYRALGVDDIVIAYARVRMYNNEWSFPN